MYLLDMVFLDYMPRSGIDGAYVKIQMFDIAQQYLKDSRLIIAPEKIQTSTPYHYLKFIVNRQYITPQLTQIHVNKLSTLSDFQKLLDPL